MNYIVRKARQLAEQEFTDNFFDKDSATELLKSIRVDLSDVDNQKDKAEYLTIILEANNKALKLHKSMCPADFCSVDEGHGKVNYFLQQEMERIGVIVNEDVFTTEEKDALSEILDKLLAEISNLKSGQEAIYEEIQELKKWFILGKKNWKQLAGAKITEMVAGGVIAEATAKPLLGMIKEGLRYLNL